MSETRGILPVFSVLRLVRDARSTTNAPRELLYALALRCQPAKNFISWPSYCQLAKDTQLNEITLKRAAKTLEDAKLIRRVVRANRSNCFFINVALLQEQAAEVKATDEAEKLASASDESPFDEPVQPEAPSNDRDVDDGEDEWNQGGAR
ncbi:MAG: hypothetical protein P4K86_02865 [Terracidiphilus sp.]|nr:hypothetical protein [Terracidiphilus sp.]